MLKYLIILGILLLAWCPWLEEDEALRIVDARVREMRAENPKLCPMFIHRDSIRKRPFGYTEKISYDCTIADPEYGVLKSRNTVFITFYKGVIGMPNKSIW